MKYRAALVLFRLPALGLAAAWALSGCALIKPLDGDEPTVEPEVAVPAVQALPATATAMLHTPDSTPWTPLLWPGKTNIPFRVDTYQGRPALRVDANRSMSILRHRIGGQGAVPQSIDFSWAVNRLIESADIGVAGLDDAPVRVVLAFDGDRSKLSTKARMQSELSRALMGEDMPYATLTYVWCNKRPVGTILVSPRTDRVRKVVVESGSAHLGQWRQYHRDIAADFRQAFGEEPGRLIGVAFMSDGDNTGGRATAWYGELRLNAH